MLDPDLFERYMTGVDRIDEDWVIQSNPPSAFKADQKEGCDALFELLQIDSGLHANRGMLTLALLDAAPLDETTRADYLSKMAMVVRTAERELKGI